MTTNRESPLSTQPRLKPAVKDMEKKNSRNNPQNRALIEKAKTININDALTRALRHYPARVPYNVR